MTDRLCRTLADCPCCGAPLWWVITPGAYWELQHGDTRLGWCVPDTVLDEERRAELEAVWARQWHGRDKGDGA